MQARQAWRDIEARASSPTRVDFGERIYNENNSNSSMLYLIFPKLFEAKSFLLCLRPGEAFTPLEYNSEKFIYTSTCSLITEGENLIKARIVCPNDSDISFSIILTRWMSENRSSLMSSMVILCGTAGGSSTKSHLYGSAHVITKAYKVDRGTARLSGNIMMIDFDETKRELSQTFAETSEEPKIEVCANYVCHIDPSLLRPEYDLVSMESFEFFKLCELFSVKRCFAIRVVSDIHGLMTDTDYRVASKTLRKRVSFLDCKKLVSLLVIENNPDFSSESFVSISTQVACRKFLVKYFREMEKNFPLNDQIRAISIKYSFVSYIRSEELFEPVMTQKETEYLAFKADSRKISLRNR